MNGGEARNGAGLCRTVPDCTGRCQTVSDGARWCQTVPDGGGWCWRVLVPYDADGAIWCRMMRMVLNGNVWCLMVLPPNVEVVKCKLGIKRKSHNQKRKNLERHK